MAGGRQKRQNKRGSRRRRLRAHPDTVKKLPFRRSNFPLAAMLYIAAFPGGWFKLGHTSTDFWRRACQFWTNTHPTDLRGKLGPENVELQALFVGGRAEEQQLFAEFQPRCGEFFHESERSMQSLLEAARLKFDALPLPPKPEWGESAVEKLPCCGGVEYSCFTAGPRSAAASS